ncbi:MAG: hypothetical protein M1833_001731 [Piccolia ochrophora]|nr:MAG: hypothetical protein M1833_001731 [Piccolia ochrophora]
MSSFTLSSSPPVPVALTSDLSQTQLLSFPAFKTWLSTLQQTLSLQRLDKSHTFHSVPYTLRSIDIQSVDFFGEDRIGFIKLKADVSNDHGERLPGSIFLRGGSVGMMVILSTGPMTAHNHSEYLSVQVVLQPDDAPSSSEIDKHILLTLQPRVPAGSLSFAELPAGMLDDSGTFAGAAAREIKEETGLEIPQSELTNLTSLAIPATKSDIAEDLQRGVYPSPGGCDEYVPIFLHQRRVPREQLKEWQGKLTGLRAEGEKITLKIVRLNEAWKVGARDAKVLSGWALYEGLRKEGKLGGLERSMA